MGFKLTDEMMEYGKQMLEYGFSYYEISMAFSNKFGFDMNPESVRYYLTRKDKPKLTAREKLIEDGIEKVLVLSDLHIPFNREDILDIVDKHKDEISTLVLGGDILDCHGISSFATLEPRPLVEEMADCHKILKQIQDIIPNVRKILIKGNHELRYEKYLCKATSELNKLHSDNILKEVVKGFEHNDRQNGKVIIYDKLDYEVIDSWYCQVNDMIVCHPLNFSRVSAKTAQMALDYFVEQGMGFNCCLVAHTHKCSSTWKYGKYAVEIGAMCKPQEYANKGRLTYTQQLCGYHLAVFKNGLYDVNESRQFIL